VRGLPQRRLLLVTAMAGIHSAIDIDLHDRRLVAPSHIRPSRD
jgi:hypothetical protein